MSVKTSWSSVIRKAKIYVDRVEIEPSYIADMKYVRYSS